MPPGVEIKLMKLTFSWVFLQSNFLSSNYHFLYHDFSSAMLIACWRVYFCSLIFLFNCCLPLSDSSRSGTPFEVVWGVAKIGKIRLILIVKMSQFDSSSPSFTILVANTRMWYNFMFDSKIKCLSTDECAEKCLWNSLKWGIKFGPQA